MRRNFLARPAVSASDVCLRLVAVWPVWRPVVRLSAAGEGVFTYPRSDPQPLFLRKAVFFDFFVKLVIFQYVTKTFFVNFPLSLVANIETPTTH